jgi:mono/diheme cytochrome c family protein
MELGRRVFTEIAQPPCGACHRLADASTQGTIGADLGELQPDEERVLAMLRQGSGVMPSFQDKLSEKELRAVAYYVARAAKRAK